MEIEMNNEGDIQRLKVDQYGIDNLTFCLYLNQSHTTRTITYRKKFLYSFIKRLFDIVASIIALIILFIPMLIIGIGVKLTSKGPMIYVSTRIGKNGKKFRFYKFRSMRKDAEKELSQLLEKNEVKGGVTFKMENDPRVTRYGRFLRKTSLDELPQLFNILKGDMTFVGPRPCTDRDICDIIDASKVSLPSTLLARGISCKVNHIGGLAQVNSLFVSFIRNGRKTLVASPFFNMRRESNIYA